MTHYDLRSAVHQIIAGHRHNDGLRIVSKEILKVLWRTARELHTKDSQ